MIEKAHLAFGHHVHQNIFLPGESTTYTWKGESLFCSSGNVDEFLSDEPEKKIGGFVFGNYACIDDRVTMKATYNTLNTKVKTPLNELLIASAKIESSLFCIDHTLPRNQDITSLVWLLLKKDSVEVFEVGTRFFFCGGLMENDELVIEKPSAHTVKEGNNSFQIKDWTSLIIFP